MTNEPAQSGASTPDAPQFSRFGTKGLEGYLAANRSKFTEDALRDAAIASGWDASIVETTLGAVRDAERSAPTRARARRLVRLLYIAAFLALSSGMIVNAHGVAAIGIPILGATLATAYFWAIRRFPAPPWESGRKRVAAQAISSISISGYPELTLSMRRRSAEASGQPRSSARAR